MTKENNKQTKPFEKESIPPITVEVDLTKYAAYLETIGLTEDEQNRQLVSLWMILQMIMDAHEGAIGQPKICGKHPDSLGDTPSDDDRMLCSNPPQTNDARSDRAERSASCR